MMSSSSHAVSIADMSQAKLDALAALYHSYNYNSLDNGNVMKTRFKSPLTGELDRPPWGSSTDDIALTTRCTPSKDTSARARRPSSAKITRNLDLISDQLERVGSAPLLNRQGYAEKRRSKSGKISRLGRTSDNICIGSRRRASSAGRCRFLKNLGERRTVHAEDIVARQEADQGRSHVSVRFLREHARKTQEEGRVFLKTMRQEAKANEDSQMESIHRATQWSRELGTGVVYLPHYSMCGKLGVLKMEKGETVPEKGKTEENSPVREEGRCKVISVESFLKTDFVKVEKRYLAHRDTRSNWRARFTPTKEKPVKEAKPHHQVIKNRFSGRTNSEQTRQQLHRLIRDTSDLIEVLTAQAVELERQGWNQTPGRKHRHHEKTG